MGARDFSVSHTDAGGAGKTVMAAFTASGATEFLTRLWRVRVGVGAFLGRRTVSSGRAWPS